jgi:hypothetical protein
LSICLCDGWSVGVQPVPSGLRAVFSWWDFLCCLVQLDMRLVGPAVAVALALAVTTPQWAGWLLDVRCRLLGSGQCSVCGKPKP